jgi:hypothetical protein
MIVGVKRPVGRGMFVEVRAASKQARSGHAQKRIPVLAPGSRLFRYSSHAIERPHFTDSHTQDEQSWRS